MANFVCVRTQKITRANAKNLDAHNRRLSKPENADPNRSSYRVHGDDTGIIEAIEKRFEATGAYPRKNSTAIAQEVVLNASPEYFRPEYHRDDPEGFGEYDKDRTIKWAQMSLEWLADKYGSKNLISVDLHLDERTPHIHAVVTPILEKTLNKRRTKEQIKNGEPAETYKAYKFDRDTVFGRKAHMALQDEYASALASLGLQRGVSKYKSKAHHQDQRKYYNMVNKALKDDEKKKVFWDFEEPKFKKKSFF
ncbi:MobV family relaxase, partial [Halomonas shantousis]